MGTVDLMGEKKIKKEWWNDTNVNELSFRHAATPIMIKSESLPALMTIPEVAKFFRCTATTINRWIKARALPSRKIMGRRFVTPDDIGYFMDMQQRKNGQKV